MNTSQLTKTQIHVLGMAEDLCERSKENRWFTKTELSDNPNVRPLDRLVEKKYLEQRSMNGIVYYRRVKEKLLIKGNIVYTDIVQKNTIVLDADDIAVTIAHPHDISENDAIEIAKEFIDEECGREGERSSHGE